MKRILLLLISLLAVSSLLCSCSEPQPQTQAKSYYEYFDTVSAVFSYKGDDPTEFEENCAAVEEILKEYHRLLDIYYEYDGINNIKTINDNAGKEAVKVDKKIVEFLLYCKELYAITDGETNIAMGAVLTLWHDARETADTDPKAAVLPSAEELHSASEHTDIDNIIIDEEGSTVYLADPLMSIDVGAIGKGYAAEKAAQLLISRGVTSYVLNIGGNIRAIGAKPNGKGWETGITNPDKNSDQPFVCRVMVKDTSLVTSGDYERYFTVNGKNYHHIIDKDTNMPSEHFSSVSVFAADSGLADALSTALFCMSYEDGSALISRIGGIKAIWVSPDGSVKMTDGITFSE
ncbi:MAG: FAD:protein FMN transferase [Ruminococcaceae bacterium]|nr:FAD:protein FMN transferase [Oscillospiraceae bacterium]